MSYAAHVRGGPHSRRYFQLIRHAAVAVLQASQAVPSDVTIALVDDDKMRELNRRHAHADMKTDVLSFESGAIDPETARLVLGDIAICLPVAREQADEAGHSLEDELALLTVHGVLHLLGYDHADAEGRRQMWDRQAAVLHELGHTAVAR